MLKYLDDPTREIYKPFKVEFKRLPISLSYLIATYFHIKPYNVWVYEKSYKRRGRTQDETDGSSLMLCDYILFDTEEQLLDFTIRFHSYVGMVVTNGKADKSHS